MLGYGRVGWFGMVAVREVVGVGSGGFLRGFCLMVFLFSFGLFFCFWSGVFVSLRWFFVLWFFLDVVFYFS